MACWRLRIGGNLGDPVFALHGSEYAQQAIKSEEGKIRSRESDDRVVPMKVGNAAGGKAITVVRSIRRDTYRAQKR